MHPKIVLDPANIGNTTTSLPPIMNQDKHEEMYARYRIGFTLIVVQQVGEYLNVFTNEHKDAKEALDAYEDWIKHFKNLDILHPVSDALTKVIIKEILVFGEGKNRACILGEITIDKLTELAKPYLHEAK
jgi:hypothetical protein